MPRARRDLNPTKSSSSSCRARSDCIHVQSDLDLHFLQGKCMPQTAGSGYRKVHVIIQLYFAMIYVRKQPVAWKKYCAEYWLKELQEITDRSTAAAI